MVALSVAGGVAGLMVREKTDLSCWCLAITISDSGSVVVRTRLRAESPVILTAPIAASKHEWLRLVRHGGEFTAFHSPDGETWSRLSSLKPPGLGLKVPVGFFASGATKAGSATAMFDHIALTVGK